MRHSPEKTKLFGSIDFITIIILNILIIGQVRAGTVTNIPVESPTLMATNFNPLINIFADIAEKLKPTVVKIDTTVTIEKKSDELKKRHGLLQYLMPPDLVYKKHNYGSGIIYSEDGYIITNTHLVENIDKITVGLLNNDEYTARIVGTDPTTDLALIKIDNATGLVAAKFGDSDATRVGEWVMAIGHPLQNNYTVSVGVIGAKGRHLGNNRSYDEYLQTDASINPGNSGGPLINSRGEVVGINSWIMTTTGGSIGLGFSIPSNLAMYIIPILKTKKKVTRGWLGVVIQPVRKETALFYHLDKPRGALISMVIKDSPADNAGLHNGDIIIKYDGKPINGSGDLPKLVSRTPIGKTVKIEIVNRNHRKTRIVQATIKKLVTQNIEPTVQVNNWLGMTLEDLTPNLVKSFSLPSNIAGVLITEIDIESPFDGKLQEGDIILEINHESITDISNMMSIINQVKPGDILLFYLWRKGMYFYYTYTLQEKDF